MANPAGERPWLDNNPATPNDAFFRRSTRSSRTRTSAGSCWPCSRAGATTSTRRKVLTTRNARVYGRWLGSRYKSAPNMVWMMGGDRPCAGFEEVWRELAAGLREGDGGVHLVSYHPCFGRSSADYFHQDETLSFNMIQTWAEWFSVHPAVLSDVVRTPPSPWSTPRARTRAGPSIRRGRSRRSSCGGRPGGRSWPAASIPTARTRCGAWRRGGRRRSTPRGPTQVARMKQILTSRGWWDLLPDQSLFASGVGSDQTLNAAMRSGRGDHAIVYLASACKAVLHLDKIAGRRVRATWVNPATGDCGDAGAYDTGNVDGKTSCDLHPQAFSTPGPGRTPSSCSRRYRDDPSRPARAASRRRRRFCSSSRRA